ncbi:FAD-dependent monooxygenase [Staphylococcus sp. SQ8-PEA]|uniref:FAD-dependent monooxygenase n=1 Tax=Staphylococcus marylandisciuri TaxID=2981529 RepID=A0ABT2QMM6_9STAP|nr:FAD-dependent monooxygenase [Staphylococcus marylandisciuri]MCU5745209.1 FAD-dependent monooxygenase [Staphylococcus marylandisciuri]
MKIAVVGAGIGGLTAAALLSEEGHEVKVFEKEPEIKELGSGIGIGDNVLSKLGNHDLAKGLKNAGQVVNRMQILSDQAQPLSTVELKKNSVNLTLKRQSLIDVIASYVPDSDIYTGHKVVKIDNSDMKVTVHFQGQESETFDLCLGADGIHSVIRENVAPKCKVNYQGYTVFRGMVEDVQLEEAHVAREYWGAKGRVGIVPLLNNQAYWFISINAKEKDEALSEYGKPHLQARFNHYPDDVRQILDKQGETGILHHDMYDLKPLDSFVYGRTILIGDAAHATTPNMGQGAGQAMEDAIVLVNCLRHYDFNESLKRFNQIRVKHTAKVIKRSRKIGKIAQHTNPLVIRIRNMIAKALPNSYGTRQTKFLYKSKAK